jgi:beta-N-acetylhexosaminidase
MAPVQAESQEESQGAIDPGGRDVDPDGVVGDPHRRLLGASSDQQQSRNRAARYPHVSLPALARSRADWERIDLAPYRTLLATGNVHAIMVTHEMIPAVDSQYPSSLSPAVIDGELRQKLGFQGVVITDSLVMGALNNRWTVAQAAALAIKAGADMIIGPQNAQVVAQVKDALKAAIASGKLSQARIDTSVKRVLTLKITIGLLPIPHPTSQASPASHSTTPTNTPKKNSKSPYRTA